LAYDMFIFAGPGSYVPFTCICELIRKLTSSASLLVPSIGQRTNSQPRSASLKCTISRNEQLTRKQDTSKLKPNEISKLLFPPMDDEQTSYDEQSSRDRKDQAVKDRLRGRISKSYRDGEEGETRWRNRTITIEGSTKRLERKVSRGRRDRSRRGQTLYRVPSRRS